MTASVVSLTIITLSVVHSPSATSHIINCPEGINVSLCANNIVVKRACMYTYDKPWTCLCMAYSVQGFLYVE